MKPNPTISYRYENFGGIISSQEPPFLAFVDQNYMLDLGLPTSSLWNDQGISQLSAPTEVHFAVTNRCSVGCQHCYMDGGPKDQGELDNTRFKQALDILAQMKVFHIALGGGEALEREDLFDIADYARQLGIVPNLTVSGQNITPTLARQMKIFGQVNVSIDGIDDAYTVHRGTGSFAAVDQGVRLLRESGIPTGINCVLGLKNFNQLENLYQYARKRTLNEIEFLRFKPSGRGKTHYMENRTSHDQNKQLVPQLAHYSKKYNVPGKIDCSFVPMYCYHNPPPHLLETTAVYGCEAGNVLLGIRSNGRTAGCSFLESPGISVFDLPQAYSDSQGPFKTMRRWVDRAPEPCRSCDYLHICKGGCQGVSEYVLGDYDLPDPDCPRVKEYKVKS